MATYIDIALVLDDEYQIAATAQALKDGKKGVNALIADLYRKGENAEAHAKFAQYKATVQILDALAERYAQAVREAGVK